MEVVIMDALVIVLDILSVVFSAFACVGVIISAKNLLFLKKQFLANYEVAKKKATIDFFNETKKQSKEIERKLFKNQKIDWETVKNDDDLYYEIKEYLGLLEHFSVGVNIHIYDFDVANRLSGSFFINKYEQMYQFIVGIRGVRNDASLYCEFEYMVDCLKGARKEGLPLSGNLKNEPQIKSNKSNH